MKNPKADFDFDCNHLKNTLYLLWIDCKYLLYLEANFYL